MASKKKKTVDWKEVVGQFNDMLSCSDLDDDDDNDDDDDENADNNVKSHDRRTRMEMDLADFMHDTKETKRQTTNVSSSASILARYAIDDMNTVSDVKDSKVVSLQLNGREQCRQLYDKFHKIWTTIKKTKECSENELCYLSHIAECHVRLRQYVANVKHRDPHFHPSLCVDTHEREPWMFFEHLKDSCTKFETLTNADYHFKLGKEVLFMYERKTFPRDLDSGNTDGRFREQRDRLQLLDFPPNQIAYIFEHQPFELPLGSDWSKLGHVRESFDTLCTMMYDLRHLHGMQVNETMHMLHTVWMLSKEFETIVRNVDHFIDVKTQQVAPYVRQPTMDMQHEHGKYTSGFAGRRKRQFSKRDAQTPEHVMSEQLCCVNGVSWEMAQAIANKYKSMDKLFEAYQEAAKTKPATRETLLADITYTPKTSKRSKKINLDQDLTTASSSSSGPKRKRTKPPRVANNNSSRIFHFLHGQKPPESAASAARKGKKPAAEKKESIGSRVHVAHSTKKVSTSSNKDRQKTTNPWVHRKGMQKHEPYARQPSEHELLKNVVLDL